MTLRCNRAPPPKAKSGSRLSVRAVSQPEGRINFDFSLVKNFKYSENIFAQLRAETFNVFNHPDFALPGHAFGGPGFGVINTATDARTMQLRLRVVF